jgi:hypothetical protein
VRAFLVALLACVLAAPALADNARRRHPRPDRGRIIHELPHLRQDFGGQARQHWRGNYGYRPYRPFYGYGPRSYGYGYGGYYGYRPAPLCTYWSRGTTAFDWYGNPYFVPPQPFLASCW